LVDRNLGIGFSDIVVFKFGKRVIAFMRLCKQERVSTFKKSASACAYKIGEQKVATLESSSKFGLLGTI